MVINARIHGECKKGSRETNDRLLHEIPLAALRVEKGHLSLVGGSSRGQLRSCGVG